MGSKSLYSVLTGLPSDPDKWRKIPWHDPVFSRRMLKEHLSQAHDRASRRAQLIGAHVDWIHRTVLGASSAAILDLGCGPGFYVDRLVQHGHTCTGLDISPASIDYAQQHHAGEYVLGDMRTADFGSGYDLVMLIYGELNAFSPTEAEYIIQKAHAALKTGGKLLLEVSPREALARIMEHPQGWFTAESGLFAEQPHLCLTVATQHGDQFVATYVVQVEGQAEIDVYTSMHYAYTDAAYHDLVVAFAQVDRFPSLAGEPTEEAEFFVLCAIK